MLFKCPHCQQDISLKIETKPKKPEAEPVEHFDMEALPPLILAALTVLKQCNAVSLQHPIVVLTAWTKAYPHVQIVDEILKCESWATSNHVIRSPKGWQRCLNIWLSKAQDRAQATPVNTKFAGI